MIHVKEILLTTQITSVKVKGNYVFVGEGQYLHIHNLLTGEKLVSIRVYRAAAIHGMQLETPCIKYGNNIRLLLWGQKSLAVACFNQAENKCWLHLQEIHFEDWIIDAAWESTAYIVVATAHNNLLHVSLPKDDCVRCICAEGESSQSTDQCCSREHEIVAKEQCSENSILYCGLIVIGSGTWENVTFLAGTVFSQILIWGPWGERNHLKRILPTHCLTGHQGVLFSVNFCPEKCVITSTSDDRSLIVWSIHKDASHVDSTAGQRGFWQFCHIVEELKCFGHGSRVWKSLILPSCYLSIGEDSKVCVWGLDGTLLKSWRAHYGSCVWTLSASEDATTIVTGGGDGSVKSWYLKLDEPDHPELITKLPCNLETCGNELKTQKESSQTTLQAAHVQIGKENVDHSDMLEQVDNTHETNYNIKYNCDKWEQDDSRVKSSETDLFSSNMIDKIQKDKTKKATQTKEDFPRCVTLLGLNTLFVMMDSARLYSWCIKLSKWYLVYEDIRLRNYALMESSPSQDLIALGTLCGCIIILRMVLQRGSMEVISDECILDGKVFSLLWLDSQRILTCGSEGHIVIVDLLLSEGKLQKNRTHVLPPCKQRWVSAACVFAALDKDHLICGDRAGSIHLYADDSKEALHSLRSIHGRNGVTSLVNYHGLVYSTGRDGCIRSVTVQNNCLQVLTVSRVSSVNWVASLIFIHARMLAVCFHDVRLKLWSLEEDQASVDIECGGGHRSWSLVTSEAENRLSFVYIKDTNPYIFSTTLRDKLMPLIKTPVNTRETMCLETLYQRDDVTIFATGGEDTTVRLHAISSEKISTISVIRSHISNVRAMCCIEDMDRKRDAVNHSDTVWLITAGGRAQLKVWKLSFAIARGSKGDQVKQDVRCREVTSHMLRTGSSKTWKSQEMTFDPETRYMDATALWISATKALIVMASSDGVLRFFEFDSHLERLQLLTSKTWDHCFLRVKRIHLGQESILITTATDGFIIFWNLQPLIRSVKDAEVDMHCYPVPEISEIARIKAHQSGINSIALDESDLSSGTFRLASGGDDNKITVWEMKFTTSNVNELSVISSSHVYDAFGHASQITGLNWLTQNYLLSCSIDQRVIVWKITQQDTNIRGTMERTSLLTQADMLSLTNDFVTKHVMLEEASSHFSGVPDIKGVSVITLANQNADTAKCAKNELGPAKKRIFIYGVGLQVYDIEIE